MTARLFPLWRYYIRVVPYFSLICILTPLGYRYVVRMWLVRSRFKYGKIAKRTKAKELRGIRRKSKDLQLNLTLLRGEKKGEKREI